MAESFIWAVLESFAKVSALWADADQRLELLPHGDCHGHGEASWPLVGRILLIRFFFLGGGGGCQQANVCKLALFGRAPVF